MRRLGFKEFLSNDHKGYIITSFHYPDDDNFQFDEFYNRLRDMGELLVFCAQTNINPVEN